ncbi:hypothetical protein [Streptomyces sp. NPDC093097]|uniref:hypothetical protein n=1 Tax=Streptomyces sp. NPDC093097 TaxID=3366027 RepID=UPI0038114F5E
MNDVKIIRCTTPTELYRHYQRQTEPQNAYIELDLREGTLLATYNAEVGNARPFTVHYGFERRYPIPLLTAEAANRVMEEIAPMASRMLADWEQDLDARQSNLVAKLGTDAQAAEAEIQTHLGGDTDCGFAGDNQGFDAGDLVAVWELDGAVNGCEADEYGITAETTDERLEEIATEITRDLAALGESKVAVVDGLDDHLDDLREKAREEDQRDLWVIVAATGDLVDGAEMTEVDQLVNDHLWTLRDFTALARKAGYGPENPNVLIYLQTDDETLTLPNALERLRLDVPSRVAAAVAAVERPAA